MTAGPLGAALAVVLAAAPRPVAPAGGADGRAAAAPMVVAQVPVAGAAPQALAGGTLRGESGEGGRLLLVPPKGSPRVLTASFHSAADPEVSFDGRSILFAGKKTASDPWCVFEMKADGTSPRQITCGKGGGRQPVYQSTVYTITPTNVEPWVQVAFVGVNPGERNEAGVAANTSLWSCKTDGTALRRLTYNLSNDQDPVVLPDGRMIYAGWLRHSADHGPNGRVVLLGVNLDGTDYQIYAGDEGRRVKQMPTPTTSGLVVFVESDEVAADGAGRLASVSQRRPLHSHRAITGEADGLFHSPSALPEGRVLVSWRPADGSGTFGVYRLDPATGAREKAFDDPAWHDVQAKLVAPRPVPDARSSVVREDDPEGKLFAVDVNLHDLGAKLPRGVAKRLRVVEGVPATEAKPAGSASSRRDPARGGRLLPGAGAGQHAGAAAVGGRGRAGAAQLRLGLGAQPRGAGLRGLPRGPGAHAAQPLHAGPAGAGPVAQPARGETPHGELRGRRPAARRVEVPVLPRGRRPGAPARRGGGRSRSGCGPGRPAAARSSGISWAGRPCGRGTRRPGPPLRSRCPPARSSPPPTSGRSSSGSTSEDSHEPHPRPRHPASRGRRRAGPGSRTPGARAEAADLHRGDGEGGHHLATELRRPRPQQHRRGHGFGGLRLRLRRRRPARRLLPERPLGADGQRQPGPGPDREAAQRALPQPGRLRLRGRDGEGRGRGQGLRLRLHRRRPRRRRRPRPPRPRLRPRRALPQQRRRDLHRRLREVRARGRRAGASTRRCSTTTATGTSTSS